MAFKAFMVLVDVMVLIAWMAKIALIDVMEKLPEFFIFLKWP